ncbi:sulfatase family protein [Pontiella desulfatans]|nr:sulfatase-like hydrolase/transferase [Pontiella desulfatans]
MKRRNFMMGLAGGWAASALARSAGRPNILLILSDDMGWSDIGCFGGDAETPVLDGLAKRGIRFTQFYNSARCMPTRASLLTGLHPHQAGIGHMAGDWGTPAYSGHLLDTCVTLGEVLRTAGYHTSQLGKWHVGNRKKGVMPDLRGFDRSWTREGKVDYFKHDIYELDGKPWVCPDPGSFYSTEEMDRQAVGFIDDARKQDKPFFMYAAYDAAHWPLHARPEDIEKYRGRFINRVCVLTGIESQRYAIYSFLSSKTENDNRNMNDWLDPYTVAAPRLFRDAGYMTGQFGKWHMGGGRDVNHAPFPQAYGFQESVVAFEGMGDRVMPIGHGLSSANADVPGDITWAEWHESADLHTDAAIDFIARAVESNKNFYVHVPYNDTHSPYNTDPGKESDFDHITGNTTAQLFLSELNELDKEIGRLVQAIDDLGAGGNTLVVVVGDNGAPDDAVNAILNRNGGLRGGKGSLWEGGFREPFFIRCPGLVPAGIVNDSTAVSTLDLLPTYAALSRIELPNAPFAGEDMSDVFAGSTRARQKPLFWEYASVSGAPTTSPKLAMRNGNYKLLINPDGSNAQFYDLSVDKEESNNLIGDAGLQSEISDMQAQLTAWYHEVVLGEIGEPVSVTNAAVSPGVVIYDDYTVTGGNAPNPGFGANDGVNYEFASRVSGMAATNLTGYWYNTGSRPATDFSITGNRLSAIPDNANARFEFSANGSTGFDFGSWLAGNTYELSVQMDVDVVGATYAQRMSLSLADASGLAIQEIDLGIQIGTDGAGGLGVFKRMNAGSNSGGSDVNTMIASGYAIGTPLDLKIVVQDFNSNTTDYASSYEIFVNGASVDSGSFRFNGSSSARYLIFDTAAHEGYIYYDEVKLEVTEVGGPTVSYTYPPRLSFSSIGPNRIHWNAQPASVYEPQSSTNLIDWISHGLVTNEFGTIQWLQPTDDQGAARFFRLK